MPEPPPNLLTILPLADAVEALVAADDDADVEVDVELDETEVTIGLLYAMLSVMSDAVPET